MLTVLTRLRGSRGFGAVNAAQERQLIGVCYPATTHRDRKVSRSCHAWCDPVQTQEMGKPSARAGTLRWC